MIVEVESFIMKKILVNFGFNRKKWEDLLSSDLSLKVSLPMFFYEIELSLENQEIPRQLTVKPEGLASWARIVFLENYEFVLQKQIRKSLFSLSDY